MRGNSRKYRIKSRYDNILTWANQTRVLAQSFEQLGSIIGGTLINAFKPLIVWLNRAMQSIISFAQTIANALGKIFGWTYEIKGGGVVNDLDTGFGGIEDSTAGTAGNLGEAADNLKEMNKYIASWQEVNNMTTKDDSDGGGGKGGGGGGGGGGLGGAAGGQLVQTEGLFEKYKSDIDSLYELGEYIGKVLTDAMNGINWEKVYEGARNFGKGLADFLNGLISPELFGAVGRTVAGSLNAAIYAALAFGERFDWTDFGKSIATGINEFFKMFDFASLAKTINVWANGILDAIIKAIDTIDWGMIGTRIGTFLAEIDFLQIAGKVMKTLWKALNAAFETYEGLFEKAPLETALLTLVGLTKLLKVDKIQKFIAALKGGITTVINFGKALMGSQTALEALRTGFPRLTKVIEVAQKAFSNFRFVLSQSGSFMNAFGEGINTIRNNMTNMQKGITTAVAAFAEFMVVKDSVKDIVTGTGNLAVNLLELGAAAGIAGLAMYTALGPAGIAIAAITGLVAALVGVKSAMDDVVKNDAGKIIANNLTNPNGKPISEITGEYVDMFESISNGYEEIAGKSEQIEQVKKSAEETGNSIDSIRFAIENGAYTAEEKIPEIQNLFNGLLTESKSIFTQEYDLIITGLAGSLGEAAEAAGISIGEYMGHLNSLKTNVERTYDEVTKSNQDLQEQYENGKISIEEYYAGLEENREKLSKITIETDQFKESIDSVSKSAENVDFSEFINADDSFDATGFSDKLNTVAKSANEAKDSINNSGEEMSKTLENMQTRFLEFGDSYASEKTAELISAQANSIAEGVENVDSELMNLGDTLQLQLLEKIPGIVEDASLKWEQNRNESLWFRLFGPDKTAYVESEVNEYKTGFIDPALGEIQSMYEQAGIDASTWAGDAVKPAVDSMFETTTSYMAEGVPETTTKVRNNYKEVFLGALQDIFDSEMESRTGELGKDIDDGVAKGARDNVDLIKNAMTDIGNAAETGARDALDSHSPSRRMIPVGKDVLLGIVEGFTASFNAWTASITTWATETYNLFSSNVTTTITNVTAWFSELPEKIYAAILPTIERITAWGGQAFQTFQTNVNNSIAGVVNWFSQMPGKIYSSIITFVTQTLPQWKGNIDRFFGSAIPNVINNVVHLFSDIGNRLVPIGENIIRGLWNGISNLTGWIGDKIGGFCNNLLNKFRAGFDEHSPSKEAFKIGDYFTIGLGNGLVSRFSDIYGDVESFTEKVSSIRIDPPVPDFTIPVMEEYSSRYSEKDMGRLKNTIQMDVDEKMAQMAYENRKLQDAVEQNTKILEKILSQGIVLDDNEFTGRYKRAAAKFMDRHHYEMGLYPAGR